MVATYQFINAHFGIFRLDLSYRISETSVVRSLPEAYNILESWAFHSLVLCMSAPPTADFERSFYIGNAFAGILYGMLIKKNRSKKCSVKVAQKHEQDYRCTWSSIQLISC